MKNDEAYIELIDGFLTGKLSESDQAAMQQAMDSNPELAEAVALRRLEFDVSESIIADDIRHKMAKWRDPENPSVGLPKQDQVLSTKWIAVSILLLVVAGLTYFFAQKQDSNPIEPSPIQSPQNQDSIRRSNEKAPDTIKSIAKELTPYKPKPNNDSRYLALANDMYRLPDLETLRGTSHKVSDFEKACDAFLERDYETAIVEAQKNDKTSPRYLPARYLMAHAYFKLSKFNQATAIFSEIANTKTRPYSEDSEWYLIISMLASKPPHTAAAIKTKLDLILKDAQHPYFDDAQKVMLKI